MTALIPESLYFLFQGPPWTDAELLCIFIQFLSEPIPAAQLKDQMAALAKKRSPKAFTGLWRRGGGRGARRHLERTSESALKMFSEYNPFWLQSVVDIRCTLT